MHEGKVGFQVGNKMRTVGYILVTIGFLLKNNISFFFCFFFFGYECLKMDNLLG